MRSTARSSPRGRLRRQSRHPQFERGLDERPVLFSRLSLGCAITEAGFERNLVLDIAGDRDPVVKFPGMEHLIPNLSKFVPQLRATIMLLGCGDPAGTGDRGQCCDEANASDRDL